MFALLAAFSALISIVLLVVGGHAHLAEIFLAAAVGLIATHLVNPWAPWTHR